ncbi:PREDICTED: tyrosine-protein phosphatase 10D-like [Bactrocera latifrons]|uniref:tyrosine-protein phosphatase 10D-like n=1 Tax=Bactrocera latifrons TaxID=174628 RepID=UPI0008DDFB1A|nr:PREDICTED: tyrosine-protein phosphatase 10D-like [Bactrocera latifrons]
MICKEGAIDVISIGGNVVHNSNTLGGSVAGNHHNTNGGNNSMNGHHTLQHRRKSQLITFSASSCDIKNSLSHEIILVNSNCGNSANNGVSVGVGGAGHAPRGSIIGSISNSSAVVIGNGSSGSGGNARLSFAEEDIMIVTNGSVGGGGGGGSASVSGGSGSGGSGSGNDGDLDDDVFRRRSLDVDEDDEDEDVEEDDDGLFDDVYGTHIDVPHNANDDSGGGSYEDSHAMHSSLAGSNRNSLEKDDDDIEADVISTDVSCYDQLLGTSCNTRNDEDEIATLVGEGDSYTKLCKTGVKGTTTLNGVGSGGVGENGGIIYANPFLDDEGIAESGM